jgi:hypothetical protein
LVPGVPDEKLVEDAARYRAEAERCSKLAEEAVNAAIRERLNRIARTYIQLAEQLERLARTP